MIWTISEFNGIKIIFVEEISEFSGNDRQLHLVRMN